MINKNSRNKERIRRHLRIRLKIKGNAKIPRLVVFRSNKNINAQVIDDIKGITLAAINSKVFKLKNGSNIAAAKKVGESIAEICKKNNIKQVVFDRNGYLYHGCVKALADSARENGLNF